MTTATANKYAFLIQSSIDNGDNWYTEAKSNNFDRATSKAAKIREEYKSLLALRMRIIVANGAEVPADVSVFVARNGDRLVWTR